MGKRIGMEYFSVTPYTDDETIKKQYRKLAFMLHPDKNKSFWCRRRI